MPENHSAEWLRGAVEALGEATGAKVGVCWSPSLNRQQQIRLWDNYRALLAEAEAREASVPTAAEVIAAAEKALELMSGIQPGYEEVNHATECCCNFCENNSLLSKIEDAIAAIAKLKEAQNA